MSAHLLTLREAARLSGADFYPESAADSVLPKIFRTDSRVVENGGGFIAVKGSNEDGHDYIAQAARNGAGCIFAERSYYESHKEELSSLGVMFVLAEDVTSAVVKVAQFLLNEVSPQVFGITGSVGKTTAREFLYAALKDSFKTHAAVKSYNTLLGTSMTILAMPHDTEILILELGTNHPGEIREMVKSFPVTNGIITEVSDAHLDGLGKIEGVLAAKMELSESEGLRYLSYNSDNDLLSCEVARMPEGEKMKRGGIRQVGVGYANSGIRISDVRQTISPDFVPELYVTLSGKDRKIACRSHIFGRQHAKNIAFAYSAAIQAGLADEAFSRAAAAFEVPPGRGVIVKRKNNCATIDETYNANPASMSSAVKNLLELELPGEFRRIAILGGMRELGAESRRLHEIVLNRAVLLDEVYLIGHEWDEVILKTDAVRGVWPDTGSFISDFGLDTVHNTVFLIKGSRFYSLERLLPLFEGK